MVGPGAVEIAECWSVVSDGLGSPFTGLTDVAIGVGGGRASVGPGSPVAKFVTVEVTLGWNED